MRMRSCRRLRSEALEPRLMLAADLFDMSTTSDDAPAEQESGHVADPGDTNQDGVFDQLDIQIVLQAGKYLTGGPANWSEGDWNGDGVFNPIDIVVALQNGKFVGQSMAAKGAAKDTSNVYNFPGPPASPVVGTSELIRTPNGVKVTVQTTGLTAGNAYTMWWVIFNNPDECEGGCDGTDLFNPDVAGTLAYATGRVVGGNGDATFSAHLSEGDTSKYPTDFPVEINPDVGLVDSQAAQIHVVVRDHGPRIPGLVSDQILSFSGGCDVNTCADVQFAVHA